MLRSSSKKLDKTLKITRSRLIFSSTSNKRISNLDMRSMLLKKKSKIMKIVCIQGLMVQPKLIQMPDKSCYKMI